MQYSNTHIGFINPTNAEHTVIDDIIIVSIY